MKKNQVQIGHKYIAKISGNLVPVKIECTSDLGGWHGTNTQTGRQVRIRSAAKLRWEEGTVPGKPVNKYGEEVFLHGPVCNKCSQRIGKNVTFRVNQANEVLCWHCAGVPENESLESRSLCAGCGNEAVAPKSVCCEKAVVTPSLWAWLQVKKLSSPGESSQARS